MQEKDMYSKKYNVLLCFFILTFFLTKNVISSEKNYLEISNYLYEIKNFTVSFIQDDGGSLSEGKIFIGENRLRVEYQTPSKILIILDKDKAMYYNFELDEDEFFDPQNTSAWFFFDIFKNRDFLNDAILQSKNKNILIQKQGELNGGIYNLEIDFENNPLVLRKIRLDTADTYLKLSFFDHVYNQEFSDDFFKLINPKFFN